MYSCKDTTIDFVKKARISIRIERTRNVAAFYLSQLDKIKITKNYNRYTGLAVFEVFSAVICGSTISTDYAKKGFSTFLTEWPKMCLVFTFILHPISLNCFQIINEDQKKVFT